MLSSQLVFKMLYGRLKGSICSITSCVSTTFKQVLQKAMFTVLQWYKLSALYEFCRKYNGLPHLLPSTVDFQSSSVKWH